MSPDVRAISRPRCTNISVGMLWMEKRRQQFWHRIAVHLDQPHLRLELSCRPFEDRRHCPAGTAPGRPEINEQRNVTVPCMLVEAHDAVQYNRPTFVKWQTAGPALPAIA